MEWGKYHINLKTDNVLCPCCRRGVHIIDKKLLIMFSKLRENLGIPLVITSGYRCEIHNERLISQGYPASRNSQHLLGKAFDIKPIGMNIKYFIELSQNYWENRLILDGGLGKYNWGIHIDTGKYRTWDYRA